MGDKPSERTFPVKLLKWRINNPNKPLTDEVIEGLFKTRASSNFLEYRGKRYKGPRELFNNYTSEKLTYGGFWFRLKDFKDSNPGAVISDELIDTLISPSNRFSYKGVDYKNIPQIYAAITGDKISIDRFADNVRAKEAKNPGIQLVDEDIEQCIRFMGGEYAVSYKGQNYPNIKSLYDDQPQPKVMWGTFSIRIRKFKSNQSLTDEDITNLLKINAKVAFFKGILYRWTHKVSGQIYIGISSMSLEERVRMHVRQAKDGSSLNPLSLQAAINRDGIDAFTIETIGEFFDEDEMLLAEDEAIKLHNSMAPSGFNLRDGGLGWTKQGTDVEFEGVLYPSYSVLAKQFGISEKLLDGRRRWGWSLRDALTTPLHTRNAGAKPVVVNGETYLSVAKAAKKFNVDYKKVHERLGRGWSIEDALELTNRVNESKKSVVVNGEFFKTIAAAARRFNKDPKKVWGAMDRGQSIEKALGLED